MKNKYTITEIKNTFHTEEPWINMFLFSHITIPLVYLMVNYTKITPNLISIVSLLFGILSALCYFNGYLLEGSILYVISYIFDATDGKVARLKKVGKIYGAWFDICVDRINLTLITTAIAFNVYSQNNSIDMLLLNNLFLGLAFIGFESRYNIDLYKLKNNYQEQNQHKLSKYGNWRKKYNLVKEPISLPEIFLFYMVLSPLFHIEIFIVSIAILLLILRVLKQQLFWKNNCE